MATTPADDMKRNEVMPASLPSAVEVISNITDEDRYQKERARKRIRFEIFSFLICTAAAVFNVAALYLLGQDLSNLSTSTNALVANNPNPPANYSNMLTTYNALLETLDPTLVCDITYFNSGGGKELQHRIYDLSIFTQVLFFFVLLPNLLLVMYRLATVVELYELTQDDYVERWEIKRNPALDDSRPGFLQNNNPTSRLKTGDLSPAGLIRRSERVKLRNETTGYMMIQLCQDIPELCIFFLYVAFAQRYRGYDCFECYIQGEVCEISNIISLNVAILADSALKIAVGACFLSIFTNYFTIMIRWIIYARDALPKWDAVKMAEFILLATLAVFCSFITPPAVLFAAYLGPMYYGYSAVVAGIAIASIFGAIWLITVGMFFLMAALTEEETCWTGIFCVEFMSVFIFVIPCLPVCLNWNDACQICCGCSCCDCNDGGVCTGGGCCICC